LLSLRRRLIQESETRRAIQRLHSCCEYPS
jgi:hypothetical protein